MSPERTPARGVPAPDWNAELERLLAGDRRAFARFNRLISGCLAELRAYDFRDEWEDLRQEVLVAVLANHRAGRLRDPQAFAGYVRIITRNKFMDRLKKQLRLRERESLPWDDETARAGGAPALPGPAAAGPDRAPLGEAWSAVGELPEEQQRILAGIYLEGKTYQEVSDETGIPLGTLKRRLRDGLMRLRRRLAPGGGA